MCKENDQLEKRTFFTVYKIVTLITLIIFLRFVTAFMFTWVYDEAVINLQKERLTYIIIFSALFELIGWASLYFGFYRFKNAGLRKIFYIYALIAAIPIVILLLVGVSLVI